MAERKKIGDLLKEAGLIDDFQHASPLAHQRNWGGKLGSLIVELKFAREEDIAQVIADKLHIPYANLFDPEIPAEIVAILKPDIAKKFGVMPVRKEGKALILAMSDPLDIETMDNIRFNTGMSIKPVLSTATEIKDAIKKYYDNEPVTHVESPPVHEEAAAPEKREADREVPDRAAEEPGQQASEQIDLQQLLQDVNNQKIVLEALVSLLIARGFIIRSELLKLIEQKKMNV